MIHLTFSACGFMAIYQLGAAVALHRHGSNLLSKMQNYAGASGGAMVAAVLLTQPQTLEQCKEFTYEFATDVRRQMFGAITPGYDFMKLLREGMNSILTADAHKKAHGRLHVSVTNAKTLKNCMISSFPTRDDLMTVLLASSFVPLYAGFKAVEYKGEGVVGAWNGLPGVVVEEDMIVAFKRLLDRHMNMSWIDGGLTNRLPILPGGRTLTVSPFSGKLDICPQDEDQKNLYITIAKQDFILSVANFVRVNHALFPPSREKMESLYHKGFDDAVTFLRNKNYFQ